MKVYDAIIACEIIVICIRFADGKYRGYFYNPFTDWDKEYYDASMDDAKIGLLSSLSTTDAVQIPNLISEANLRAGSLQNSVEELSATTKPFSKTAAPPPPGAPAVPEMRSGDLLMGPEQMRSDFHFDLPKIPLPSIPDFGPFAGGPQFATVQTYASGPPPYLEQQASGPLSGYGAFNENYQPEPYGGYNGGVTGYGAGLRFPSQNFGSGLQFGGGGYNPANGFNGGPNIPGFSDYGGVPSIGNYAGFSGYGNRNGAVGGYGYNGPFPLNSPQYPGSFGNFPNNYVAQPASFTPLQPALPLIPPVSFSSYDNNHLVPQVPYDRDVSTSGNDGFHSLPITFHKDHFPVISPLKPVLHEVNEALRREQLCKPTGRPGLTGFCRNSFDIINNRVCNNMAVDSKSRDCSDLYWCCYWRPKTVTPVRSLAVGNRVPVTTLRNNGRATAAPGYGYPRRRSQPAAADDESSDYFHVSSRTTHSSADGHGEFLENSVSYDDAPAGVSQINVTLTTPELVGVERGLDSASVFVSQFSQDDSPPVAPKRTCGRMGVAVGNLRNSRVLNGKKAMEGELCWQAAIFSGNEYICGGAVVDQSHVVTSAHCVQRFRKDGTMASLKIVLGTVDVSNIITGACNQVTGVQSIRIHDTYNPMTLSNDIALLKLNNDVPTSNCTCSLCLPDHMTGPLKIDSNCMVTGFGLSSVTNPRSYGRLRSAQVQVINSTTGVVNCQRIMEMHSGLPVDYQLDPSMFCTLSRDETYMNGFGIGDTCVKDGGSPLICALDAADPSRWTITGIVTWGMGCGRTSESIRMPSVFTNVRKQTEWISRNLA